MNEMALSNSEFVEEEDNDHKNKKYAQLYTTKISNTLDGRTRELAKPSKTEWYRDTNTKRGLTSD